MTQEPKIIREELSFKKNFWKDIGKDTGRKFEVFD